MSKVSYKEHGGKTESSNMKLVQDLHTAALPESYSTLSCIKYNRTNNFRQVPFDLLFLPFVMQTSRVPFLVAFVQLKVSERLRAERKRTRNKASPCFTVMGCNASPFRLTFMDCRRQSRPMRGTWTNPLLCCPLLRSVSSPELFCCWWR